MTIKYKSVRLLNEDINKEMEALRKLMMSTTPGEVTDDGQGAIETLNVLRGLLDQLVEFAERPTLTEVAAMPPAQYVQAMKPFVANYHRALMTANLLPQCLNEDLKANATVLFLIGDGKTVVRASHDPSKPEVALVVEAIVNGLDETMKKIASDGLDAVEEAQAKEIAGE